MPIPTRHAGSSLSLLHISLMIFALHSHGQTSASNFLSWRNPFGEIQTSSYIPKDVVTSEAVSLVGWFTMFQWPHNRGIRFQNGEIQGTVYGQGKHRHKAKWGHAREVPPIEKEVLVNPWRNVASRSRLGQELSSYGFSKSSRKRTESWDSPVESLVLEKANENENIGNNSSNDFDEPKDGTGNVTVFPFSQIERRRKRIICCNADGVCRTCLNGMDAEEVVNKYLDFFADVPRSLVEFSVLGELQSAQCDQLDLPLFPVDMSNLAITPLWVRKVSHLGWCPSLLVTKDLGPSSFPPKLIEAKCLCVYSKCSSKGADFRCVPVYKKVATWLRFSERGSSGKPFSPEMITVQIGCVCAQRPAQFGGEINSVYALP
ncbi:uncharacterized protein LOC108680145 [Hyalella azteca]|uniref:Uncharacterized protein LOC108680145 n=1 Tax=Hyalella azteca TaxID=294128 RepID=A0A8B7PGH9_HYAAZ|nr:uncharacterized protein LOC108680145 [Hyalella azteca]